MPSEVKPIARRVAVPAPDEPARMQRRRRLHAAGTPQTPVAVSHEPHKLAAIEDHLERASQ